MWGIAYLVFYVDILMLRGFYDCENELVHEFGYGARISEVARCSY